MQGISQAVALAIVAIVIILSVSLVTDADAHRSTPKARHTCSQLQPPVDPFVGSTVVNRVDLMDATLVIDQAGFLEIIDIVPMTDERGCYAIIFSVEDRD